MKSQGRTLTITSFPQEAFVVLADTASTEGVSIGEMARRVLVESLVNYGAPSWYKTFADLDRRQILSDLLFNQIHEALTRGNDDKVSELMEKAKESGLDADDIYLKASELSTKELSGSQKVDNASVFLVEMLSAQTSVQAKEIIQLAAQRGISSYALSRAKDVVGAESRRVGKHWVWELPKKDG